MHIPQATPSQVNLAAGTSKTDPRSVRKYLRGENVRAIIRERVEDALKTLRLEHLIRPPTPVPGQVTRKERVSR